MKAFLELVENLRRNGMVELSPGKPVMREFPPSAVTDKLWKSLEQSQPFVFATSLDPQEELAWGNRKDYPEIDAPFERCSVEVLGDKCLMMGNWDYINDEQKRNVQKIRCIFGAEISPKIFDLLMLLDFESVGPRVVYTSGGGIYYGQIMSQYFQRLKREAVGYQAVRERMTLGTGAEKRVVRLRRVVHVVPKKIHETYQASNRTVDWSHRWLVRGHWVSLPGKLGKDRAGDYCVQDWTWRSEHEKGPENAPLIQKTRFVQTEVTP